MRPRLRPRPVTVRPRPSPKKWSQDHAGLETLTFLRLDDVKHWDIIILRYDKMPLEIV